MNGGVTHRVRHLADITMQCGDDSKQSSLWGTLGGQSGFQRVAMSGTCADSLVEAAINRGTSVRFALFFGLMQQQLCLFGRVELRISLFSMGRHTASAVVTPIRGFIRRNSSSYLLRKRALSERNAGCAATPRPWLWHPRPWCWQAHPAMP